MNKSRLLNWACILITGFVCSFWYYMSNSSANRLAIDKEKLKNSVDITVTDISFKGFNQKGELANYLETPLVEHVPKNNTHLLTKPHIIVKEEDEAPWDINAKYAKAVKGGHKITFSKDVTIAQKKDIKNGNILLRTEEITYFPNKKYAITKKDVKLQQDESIVEATGLKAFLAENRIQFLSKARGHYEQKNG